MAYNMLTPDRMDEVYRALERQLRDDPEGRPVSLVVIGGAALAALGVFVRRTTKNVDVLGEAHNEQGYITVRKMAGFPRYLQRAAQRVAHDFGLPENWLNLGPASQLDMGLPEGFTQRLTRRSYGRFLTLYFAGRKDLIHFKLFAAVDQYLALNPENRHIQDLLALEPTEEELEEAACWVQTQAPRSVFGRC